MTTLHGDTEHHRSDPRNTKLNLLGSDYTRSCWMSAISRCHWAINRPVAAPHSIGLDDIAYGAEQEPKSETQIMPTPWPQSVHEACSEE